MRPALFALAAVAVFALPVAAQPADMGFVTGSLIEDFGPIAPVESDLAIPEGTDLKVAFDISARTDDGALSKSFVTVARFMNMHFAAGVPADHIHPAIVVHGQASKDLVIAADGETNPNAPLIAALVEAGVPIYLCGQSAAALGIAKDDLLPGVQMALSAMTAHALLADEGYSLNPF